MPWPGLVNWNSNLTLKTHSQAFCDKTNFSETFFIKNKQSGNLRKNQLRISIDFLRIQFFQFHENLWSFSEFNLHGIITYSRSIIKSAILYLALLQEYQQQSAIQTSKIPIAINMIENNWKYLNERVNAWSNWFHVEQKSKIFRNFRTYEIHISYVT